MVIALIVGFILMDWIIILIAGKIVYAVIVIIAIVMIIIISIKITGVYLAVYPCLPGILIRIQVPIPGLWIIPGRIIQSFIPSII